MSDTKAPAPPRSFNPSPKTQFLQSGTNISAHRQLVDSQAYIRARDAAVIEYTRFLCNQIPQPGDDNFVVASAAIAHKLDGMHEFLHMFAGLSETPPPAKPRVVDNLPDN